MPNDVLAVFWFRKAASAGLAAGQFNLGCAYADGRGTDKDQVQAVDWLRKAARQQEATAIQAQGQKAAQIIRADAEALAAQTYADAYGKDPQFYDFYRAMQSYDYTFSKSATGSSTILLSPDNEYLKQFKGR